nr:hypothetical protein [Tanacetum cinerariifolium]
MCTAYHNIYNYTDDLAGREKISIKQFYFRSDDEQSLELMLLKTSKIYSKGLLLLVEDLLLLEIWLRVQQMIKGSDIGIQEKKAKLFNEWERFTSNEGESIKSYYHRFLKLMNDLKRNKHFPEKITSNLKFLNNLQPEWSRHQEVDELKAKRLAKIQDPLALMANSNNPYASLAPHQDLSPFNQNYMQQPMPNPDDITDSTTTMNMALALMAKAFKLNYSAPTNNNQRISSNPRNRQYKGQNAGNLNGYNTVQNVGNQNQIGNGNLVAVRAEGNAAGHNKNQIMCYNCRGEEVGIQLQAEEYDLMAAVVDLDEIEEVNANCILMANLQQASSSGFPAKVTNLSNTYALDSSNSTCSHYQNVSKQTSRYKDSESVPLMPMDHMFLQVFLPKVHLPPPGSSSRSHTPEYNPLHVNPLFDEQ